MLWRDPRIAKRTRFAWSAMFSVLVMIALVWMITLYIVQDPTWRWIALAVGTVVCFASPDGVVCVRLLSSGPRGQQDSYRRRGPLPRHPSDAPWEFSQGQVGKQLKQVTDRYLSESTILGSHSEGFQRQLIEEMYESTRSIYAAESPLKMCRDKMGAYAVSFADWQVLCLKRVEIGGEDAMRQSPYISGRLYLHIRECAEYNADLTEFLSRNRDCTDDDLITCANARSCAFLYLMNCMNVVRGDVGDFDRAKPDWFRPFVRSILIWKEDDYRRRVGLPTMLPNELARHHSTFLTYVLEGVSDPLQQWEEAHQLKHSYVS